MEFHKRLHTILERQKLWFLSTYVMVWASDLIQLTKNDTQKHI